jgi:hypothetical protein
MQPHHTSTIQNAIAHLSPHPSTLALLLSGSVAHGLATPTSDVDLLILVTDAAYAARRAAGQLTFVSAELATYPGGFVDAKYLSVGFLREVAERGSEAARWAFEGARVLFWREGGEDEEEEEGGFGRGELEGLLREVVRYPVAGKGERMVRFWGQVEAWRWFCGEGRRKGDGYLLGLAARKLVLFGGRLVLAHNEVLYPFHKWFLRVLEGVEEKPEGLIKCIGRVLEDPSEENVEGFYQLVKGFREWEENPNGWGAQFMLDNELTWMSGNAPVDDL